MRSLDTFAAAKLEALEARALRRTLADTDRSEFPYIYRGGRRLISFSCNDYFGLSVDARVKAAATAAVERFGAGAGASRLVTGNHSSHASLERKLAASKGSEAGCLFGSGYLANVGVLGALAGPEDLVLIDALAHNCLNAGAAIAGSRVIRFAHNDHEDVARLLASHRKHHRHALIVTETVFSMDGDRAPLAALSRIAATHDTWLMADDAHGLGLEPQEPAEVPIAMGTLSKALGSYGGYCCASGPVIELIRTRARSLIYSTALPPACVAAAEMALDILEAEPELGPSLLQKARLFTELVGLPGAQSAIVPVVLGDAEAALRASTRLEDEGFLVVAIRPPSVPHGAARLRLAFSTRHDDDDIARLAAALRQIRSDARITPCPAFS